jgi:hypothetical protein
MPVFVENVTILPGTDDISSNSTPIFKSNGDPIERNGKRMTTRGVQGKAYVLLENMEFKEMIITNGTHDKYRLIFETTRVIEIKD